MPTMPTHPELAEFIDEMGWKPETVRVTASNLRRWETWLGTQHVDVLAADHTHLRTYLAERDAAGIGSTTRHKDWQHVRAFYTWAARPIDRTDRKGRPGAGLLATDPMARCRPPELVVRAQRSATPADAAAMVDYFVAIARQRRGGGEAERAWRSAAIISLLMRSGVRGCEVPWIDVAHLVRDPHGTLVACHIDGAHTKNGQDRLVPLTDETPTLLARYLRRRGDTPGPLFLGRVGHTARRDGRLSTNAVQQVVRRAATACGLTFSAHDFRRGWAVISAARGVDRGWLKIIGGWDKDVMLDRYLGPEKRRLAVDEFHATVTGRTAAGAPLRVVGA